MKRNLVKSKEAAKYLGISESMLAKDRMNGGRIPYVTIGERTIRYDLDELDRYIKENIKGS